MKKIPGMIKKIPEITLLFWLTKITATTLGETGGDLLSMNLHMGYAISSIILICFFLVTAVFQLAAKKYIPPLYWAVIVSTSTAGTTMSDYIDRTLGLSYGERVLILIIILIIVLGIWRITEKSISVSDIKTRRAELFYWTAILFSNTLGTTQGDFLAANSGLGFAGGAILISSVLALVVVAHYFTKISSVILFWIAFILTRPFGTTFGDVLTKSHSKGGLHFGSKYSSLVLFSLLVVLVIYESFKEKTASVEDVSPAKIDFKESKALK
jgi:uncharacterized membrane-anchored protein